MNRTRAHHDSLAASACLVLIAALAPLCGCFPQNQRTDIALPQPWAEGGFQRVAADTAPRDQTACFSRADNRIQLHGAINEVVAFQFILSAADKPADGLEISLDELTSADNRIAADRVRIYRFWPIAVERFSNWYLRSQGFREPRDIPDALVPVTAPRHGQPFALRQGESLSLWVEIGVPDTATPGVYRSHVVVKDAGGGATRTPLELRVRNIRLSASPTLPVLAGVQLGPIIAAHTQLDPENLFLSLNDETGKAAVRDAFRMLHEHGLSPFTTEVYPGFVQNVDGSLAVDWSQFDEVCGPLIDGTAYADGRMAAAWPVPANLNQPNPEQYYGLDSAVYAAVLRRYLEEVKRHFESHGWLDRAFIQFDLPRDPNPTAADLNHIRKLATLTDLVDRRIAFVSTLTARPMKAFGWFEHHFEDLSPLTDIWATPARYHHQPTMEQQRVLGKRTWLNPDRPPFSGSMAVEAPPIHARSLAWQAFLQSHDAILLSRTTDWPPTLFSEPIRDRAQASDAWLLYPGTEFGLSMPVPSLRLKQLQQGLQDYQYLRQLESNGHGETARLAAGSLIKAAGTDTYGDNYQDGLFGRRVEDPGIWQLAREIVSEELDHALNPSEFAGGDPAGSRAAWREFLSGTRELQLWCESSRLSVDNRPEQSGYLVKFEMAARNEYRTPISGELKFGPLPLEWKSVSDVVRLEDLEEMAYARKTLIASLPALPRCDLDGHFVQMFSFDAGAAGRRESGALMSVVRVPRAARPITLDGSLRDWPPTEGNIAGDFRAINNFAQTPQGRPRAESQTVAYFCRDGRMLYIGIQSAKPASGTAGGEKPRRYGNAVDYEDLMPVGEDLVEILIDPSNNASLSEDLFHIVVKATGQAVFEKGVGLTPPIGRSGPWPVQGKFMIEDGERAWSAELSIPIDAFGADALESPIWGLNISRLEPQRGEYSDWAGAPRYCYDPRSLGNMVWLD